jgi:hypothetical protein
MTRGGRGLAGSNPAHRPKEGNVKNRIQLSSLALAMLASACADDAGIDPFCHADADTDAFVIERIDADIDAWVTDAAVACRPAYVNDSGITVEARCDGDQLCVDDRFCIPCGNLDDPCCHAGTWLYCVGFSCVAGVCK